MCRNSPFKLKFNSSQSSHMLKKLLGYCRTALLGLSEPHASRNLALVREASDLGTFWMFFPPCQLTKSEWSILHSSAMKSPKTGQLWVLTESEWTVTCYGIGQTRVTRTTFRYPFLGSPTSFSHHRACQELRTSSAECTHDNLNLHGQVWLIWVDKKSTILSGVTEESIWDKKTEGTSRELDEHP